MKRRGFSLLELLVICGIISLLLVVLVPQISNAKEAAMSALCASRLRNLAMAANQYAMNEGYFPWGSIDPQEHYGNYVKDYKSMIWPREAHVPGKAENWSDFSSYCWDFYKVNGEVGWFAGIMWGVDKRCTSVLGCPKCRESDNWDKNPITGYNYNVAYLGYVEGDAGGRKYPSRWDHFKYPEKVVIFGDGGYAGGANKFMRAPKQDKAYDGSPASLRKAGTQAFRHGSGRGRHCNMAFADGHVEKFFTPYKSNGSIGWQDEQSHTGFISSGNGIYGPRGWGESDDFRENEPFNK